ncbi:MAG: DUF975 family protein [Lachnospiraceae bacterium]|nr:DUF975 family protein [Robinsoniella sp.]MDY3767854.1 DUF975 family protein [Lachnospiraceae bacterium]
MKRSSAELKALARGYLQGRYTIAIELILVCYMILFGLSEIGLLCFSMNGFALIDLAGNFMISLLTIMVSTGLSYCFLAISRGWQVRITDLFFTFRFQPDKALILSLIYSVVMTVLELPSTVISSSFGQFSDYLNTNIFLALILILTSVVCLILSVIFQLAFAMCYYIYMDHPEMSVQQIIQTGFHMMKGNKVRLFYIYISFIGLILLSCLTCFIGLLWVLPYIQVTAAVFYRELNGELPPKSPVA